jgi:hypothetical protein
MVLYKVWFSYSLLDEWEQYMKLKFILMVTWGKIQVYQFTMLSSPVDTMNGYGE